MNDPQRIVTENVATINFEFNSVATKNGLIQYPDGSLGTNAFGEFWWIISTIVFDTKLGPKAKVLRFITEPLPSPFRESYWDAFHKALPEAVQANKDKAKFITEWPGRGIVLPILTDL